MRVTVPLLLLLACSAPASALGEDYSVANIDCSPAPDAPSLRLTAQLTKPRGFSAAPVFADLARGDPGAGCSITRVAGDTSG